MLPLAGCNGALSTLDPAGPAAGSVASLWWIMLAGASVLFVLVMALLGLSYWRPQAITRFSTRQWLLGLGVGMPSVVLTALVFSALAHGETLLPRPEGPQPMRIEVTARQWQWEFAYPDIAGAQGSIDTLHLPAGAPVDLVITSADVIHGFWIPRLGGKIDAIPGHFNTIRLLADRPGTYRGSCAEFCGEGHTGMGFVVEAHAPQDLAQALGAGP